MEITIKTKFSIGDEVYYLKRGKVCSAVVNHIGISHVVKTDREYTGTTYRLVSPLGEPTYLEDFFESRLFATKQELLKHIGRDE